MYTSSTTSLTNDCCFSEPPPSKSN